MVLLTDNTIDIQALLQSVQDPSAGAVDLFLGMTRNNSKGKSVLYLEYEAYREMALPQMEKLLFDAATQFDIRIASLVHRLGRVQVGETSVAIAVSSAHRNASFTACRYIIDRLKTDVPIWKQEYYADGSVEWSHPHPILRRTPGHQ